MKLPDICGDVKQERKPANPIEELDFADLADLWR